MRIVVLFVIMTSCFAVKAQTILPVGFMNYLYPVTFAGTPHYITGTPDKKWSLTSYSSISTGFSFFNGGNATYIAAPMGLQLNRRINENLYAFAGVSAAPAYMNFNHTFLSSDINKGYPGNGFYKSNNFGAYARAELGLMYVNDAKTFSVSGSIGIEKSTYPLVPYQQMSRHNSTAPPHK